MNDEGVCRTAPATPGLLKIPKPFSNTKSFANCIFVTDPNWQHNSKNNKKEALQNIEVKTKDHASLLAGTKWFLFEYQITLKVLILRRA